MLYKLVNGEVLEAVNGCVSTGKEACVFHANGGRFVSAVVKCIGRVLNERRKHFLFWRYGIFESKFWKKTIHLRVNFEGEIASFCNT